MTHGFYTGLFVTARACGRGRENIALAHRRLATASKDGTASNPRLRARPLEHESKLATRTDFGAQAMPLQLAARDSCACVEVLPVPLRAAQWAQLHWAACNYFVTATTRTSNMSTSELASSPVLCAM